MTIIMDTVDINTIKTTFHNLRDSYNAVEEAIEAYQEQEIAKENEKLREAVERLNVQLAESTSNADKLRLEHNEMINNFKHELSSKRAILLGLSTRRHQSYLSAGLEHEQARISAMYRDLQIAMNNMHTELGILDAAEREPLLSELSSLQWRVSEQANQSRMRIEAAWRDAANRQSEGINELAKSPVEDAALGAVRRFFEWETFLGLKIISAIGALLLLLGVFTFGRYLYLSMRLGPMLQFIAIICFGLMLIGVGEFFHKKKWRGSFTLALTAGGSGTLFLGAALGYMTLGVLPMWVALVICTSVSLLTFAASLRYNAQLIAVFALIGGYLPIVAMTESLALFGAIYFTILSFLSLLLATKKNWRVARFIGLGASLISHTIIMNIIHVEPINIAVITVLGAAISIGFLTYFVIPVFGAWFTKTRIISADIVLLSCNVFFSFLLALWWVGIISSPTTSSLHIRAELIEAAVAAFFALTCIIMAFITERQKYSGVPKSETGSLKALLFITSVTFTALVALFALDGIWFSAGLLIQATGLALYGIYKNRRRFNIAALVIGLFCLFTFLTVNVGNRNYDSLFIWKYLSITLAAAVISVAVLKYKVSNKGIKAMLDIFRCAAVINLWGYITYILYGPFMPVLRRELTENAADFAALLSITFAFIFAFIIPRIKRVYNYGFQTAAIILGIIGVFWLLGFNSGSRNLTDGGLAVVIVVFALYIIVNITAVGWVNDLLRFLSGMRKLSLGWYPLLVSGFFVLMVSQNLVVQLSLKASSLILTLIFGLTALGWVLFGFAKRNGAARICGLSMAFFAVVKLFVLDLYGLETTGRIISYFTGGIVLLAISFSYQWFSKRLELIPHKIRIKPPKYNIQPQYSTQPHAVPPHAVPPHAVPTVPPHAVQPQPQYTVQPHTLPSVIVCVNCGVSVAYGDKFCTNCGNVIQA
ncbi:MAG: DUF2339 domain-containing protein [Oscillospiraceae bacterium]|nr:DUF2339 domain-containing protein [Oscillospiraceae bacterium]